MSQKRNFSLVLLVVVIIVAGFVSSAQAGGLSTWYSDSEKGYGTSMSKDVWNGGVPEYSLFGNINIRTAPVEYASVSWSMGSMPNIVTVYMNFSGQIGKSPTDTFPGDQSMSGVLNGRPSYWSVSTGYYNNGGGEKGDISDPGEDWAYGNANLSFYSNDVTRISGNASFNINDSWSPGYFSFNPYWYISFRDAESANNFGQALSATGAQEIPTMIPEPAAMSLLGLGVLALIRKRR
jgi:PEP-CTERM motif